MKIYDCSYFIIFYPLRQGNIHMLAFDFTVKSMAQTAIQAPTYGEKGAIMAQDFGDDIGEMLLRTSESLAEEQIR